MNRFQISSIISASLLIMAGLFVLAQFYVQRIGSGGGWCTPYLDAPQELGHPAYEYVSYGFPISFVTVAKENCFSQQSTTYEWFLPGIGVDGLLLGMIMFLWLQRRKLDLRINQER